MSEDIKENLKLHKTHLDKNIELEAKLEKTRELAVELCTTLTNLGEVDYSNKKILELQKI